VEFVRGRAREGKAFDLVHDMSGSFWKRAAEIDVPVLATLHLPRSFYPAGVFDDVPENVSFNCVSKSQARSFPDLDALAGVVPNGIAPDCFAGNDAAEINERGREGLLCWGESVKKKRRIWHLRSPGELDCPLPLPDKSIPFLITSNTLRGK